ncbi:MAG: DNA repair protein RadA [Chloroflexota bacterium]
MPKARTNFVCQECGGQYPTGYGRCPSCGAWNSLVETIERPATPPKGGAAVALSTSPPVPLAGVQSVGLQRLLLPLEEFNRVMGGGIVPGSVVLLGGEPGIGKSTLLLQVSNLLAAHSGPVLYATGEESAEQVRLRADRLGEISPELYIITETDVDVIAAHAQRIHPCVLIIDSIQTVHTTELESPAGSIGQIREAAARVTRMSKAEGVTTFLVGHVTKEGNLAGPKVLEHLVDTVLYMEGDRFHAYRLLRSIKNRFGSSNEVGVFDMHEDGLREVTNPSAVFLSERMEHAAGSVVTVTLEGSRPLLVEIQALVTPTHFGLPRRTATGLDLNRLVLLCAVLSKRAGLHLASQDVYVNVAGGMRLSEPASDLAAALAIASSLTETVVDNIAVIGEIGLGGEVRSVSRIQQRVNEARKLGFQRYLVPERNVRELQESDRAGAVGIASLDGALAASACRRS